MIHTVAIGDDRSIRDLVLGLRPLTLITGPNGSGKSNIYRALRLLAGAAQGQLIPALAREGGLQSTLWAGPEQPSRAGARRVARGRTRRQASRRPTTMSISVKVAHTSPNVIRMSLGQWAPMRIRAQPPSTSVIQAAMESAMPALRCRVRHA